MLQNKIYKNNNRLKLLPVMVRNKMPDSIKQFYNKAEAPPELYKLYNLRYFL